MSSECVSIGLCNPKNATNVGSVMRAVGCFQANAVYYTGKRYDLSAKFITDTQAISSSIPLIGVDDLLSSVPESTQIICVELVEGATPLPGFKHPDKAFYVFGPEDGTVRQQIIDRADAVVYIPTTGCLNLAATVNILLYDRTAKSNKTVADDALIRKSRDANNRVKVRT